MKKIIQFYNKTFNMDLYFSTNPEDNKIYLASKDWFCLTDRMVNTNCYCEEYNIIEKIRKNEDGYFDFNKNLIDVGAEDGNYSILLDFKENYCFEPNKHMCCLIYTNMYMRNKVCNTHVFNCGCGDKDETVTFNGFAQYGSGIYNTSIDRQLDPSYNVMHKITLDSLNIQNVGLIKTDTEGFDLEVLKGAVKTIKNNKYPPILFELWKVNSYSMTQEKHDEMSDFLTGLGYEIIWNYGDHETHLAVKKGKKTKK
jgi:FkbM family methyltransferase